MSPSYFGNWCFAVLSFMHEFELYCQNLPKHSNQAGRQIAVEELYYEKITITFYSKNTDTINYTVGSRNVRFKGVCEEGDTFCLL